ncbi:hypothetical protein GCM10009558_062920 [Virgisporangium aurantiacum]
MHTRTRMTIAVAAAAVVTLWNLPVPALAEPAGPAAQAEAVCGTPQKGHATCFALRRPAVARKRI